MRLETGEGEIGRPDWVPGLISMRWSGDSRSIYTVRRHESRDAILRVTWPDRKVTGLDTQWTEVSGLNVLQDALGFLGARGTVPPALVTLDGKGSTECVRATGGVGIIDGVVSFRTQGHFMEDRWRHNHLGHIPDPARTAGPAGGAAPVDCLRSRRPDFRQGDDVGPASAVFCHSRLALPRSSIIGVAAALDGNIQDSLNGEWGVLDVQDARSGAINLVDSGHVDPARAVIMGGSAGGYTTLMALTLDPDFWAAGVSLYGIGNMYEVKQGSHRFEVNYEERLIGRLPEAGALWKERSPLTHVKNVRAPVLLFHGTEDKAVPYQQSVEFAEAVRRNGGIADLVSYQGEGHGFVKEANRRDLIEQIERFLNKYVICQQRP